MHFMSVEEKVEGKTACYVAASNSYYIHLAIANLYLKVVLYTITRICFANVFSNACISITS